MLENYLYEQVEYLKLTPSFAKQYRSLRLESLKKYPNHFGSEYKEQNQKLKLAFEIYIENQNPYCFVIGAFHSKLLIGICAFYIDKDGSQDRGEIIQMYVQPNYQGHKIGFNLLKETIRAAFIIGGLNQIELRVHSNNKPAIKVYENIGFQPCGLVKNYIEIDGLFIDQSLMVLYRGQEE